MPEPTPEVRAELAGWLDRDESKTGQVYRLTQEGLRPDEIAARLGVRTSGFVSNYRTIARAMLEGHLPSGATMAQQVANVLRKVVARPELSSASRSFLQEQIEALGQVNEKRWTLNRDASAPATAPTPPPEPSPTRRGEQQTASLRAAVEAEIADRVRHLSERIRTETGVAATDYWAVTTSDRPLEVVVRLLRLPGERPGTFKELVALGRLDLSLEAAVSGWAADLPLQQELVEDAEAKRSWFTR